MKNTIRQFVFGALFSFALILAAQIFIPTQPPVASAQDVEGQTYPLGFVGMAEYTGDVRNLPAVASPEHGDFELEDPLFPKFASKPNLPAPAGKNSPLAPMPSPIQNFAGISRTDLCPPVTGTQCGAGTPPDPNGDVGLNYYIQAVNSAYAIYDKTGALQGSFTENSLFTNGTRPGGLQGTGTLCDTNSFGDPIVVYDQFADRWFITNFAFVLTGNGTGTPTYQCIAASKTSNPVTGGWWLYALQIDTNAVGQPPTGSLGDYPKFGNWNDGCLYMSANVFSSAGSATGVLFASFNKSAMESGATLTGSNSSLGYTASTTDLFSMVPSNISGAKGAANLPPVGTPNFFVSESTTAYAFYVRRFTPGAGCGAGGTLGVPTILTHASYSFGSSVPQPSPGVGLDALEDRIMQKVQYRRVGAAESLWVVHTTATSPVRSHWAQIDVTTGGTVTILQQQFYAPDTLNRWMGSIAADHVGNVALGYSTSSSANYPSIAYSGRLVGDTLNQLPQTEVQLIAGGGSQGSLNRWGDYSAMSVDPADDCTFWYTSEYYDTPTNGAAINWHTRIGSFMFPTCTPSTAVTLSSFEARSAEWNQFAIGLGAAGILLLGSIGIAFARRSRRK